MFTSVSACKVGFSEISGDLSSIHRYSEAVVMTGMLYSCFLYVSAAELIRVLGPCSVGIEGSTN